MNLCTLKLWLQAKLNSDERGAALVEYGFLLALIAMLAIAGVSFLGDDVSTKFSSVGSSVGAS